MKHQFRARLLAGELLVGTMISLTSPAVTELMADVGFDWLFIDAEHGTFGTQELQAVLQSAKPETPCLVRVSQSVEVPIKKALDIGAAGIIAPQINSVEAAERVVRFSKYSPEGTRGVGISRAHGYGLKVQEYLDTANEEVAVIIQAEHIDAVENIEAIVKVPGIDAVLVGPYDLSASLGKIGQVNDPEVMGAIEHVTRACKEAGVKLGAFGVTVAAVKPFIDNGFTLITASIDTLMLGQAAQNLLAEIKNED
jgi:2-keto-3-deoxy-L-rhamnonate aldolase RhmA